VADRVAPAVVTVINRQTSSVGDGDDPSDDIGIEPPEDRGAGTGFIIDEQGHIVTNAHVVEGGTAFRIILFDGEEREAELVGADPVADLAVVRIEGTCRRRSAWATRTTCRSANPCWRLARRSAPSPTP
jgi:S1-C subfamily serine protease